MGSLNGSISVPLRELKGHDSRSHRRTATGTFQSAGT